MQPRVSKRLSRTRFRKSSLYILGFGFLLLIILVMFNFYAGEHASSKQLADGELVNGGFKDKPEDHIIVDTEKKPQQKQEKTPTKEVAIDDSKPFTFPFRARPTSAKEHPGAGRSSAWLDLSTSVLHAQTSAGAEMLFPVIYPSYRDRRKESVKADGGSSYEKWASKLASNDPLNIPKFANDKERNTLQHASIFISIAAFRDVECPETIKDLLAQARHPHRLYFGLSEEREPNERSCLEAFGLKDVVYSYEELRAAGGNAGEDGDHMTEAKRLLYGKDAPVESFKLWRQFLRWPEVFGRGPFAAPETNPTKITIEPTQKYLDYKNYAAMMHEGAMDEKAKQILYKKHNEEAIIPKNVVLMDEKYMDEKIVCLLGEPELLRDRLRLQANSAGSKSESLPGAKNKEESLSMAKLLAFRKGKGGAQEGPFPAMAGCRVTSRLAPMTNARGPTYGRYVTSLFYFQQDYFMVIDSHSRFSLHYDAKMILRIYQAPTRAVLSHYPLGYTPEDPRKEFTHTSVMSMCMGQVLANGMPKLGARWLAMGPAPVIQAFAAAGYMFGDAYYVIQNPFDPLLPYLFDGEEILFSVRMWTSGIDIYCPAQANIFHYYGRPKAPRNWDRQKDAPHLKKQSENRALYLLQRYLPWAERIEKFSKIQEYLKKENARLLELADTPTNAAGDKKMIDKDMDPEQAEIMKKIEEAKKSKKRDELGAVQQMLDLMQQSIKTPPYVPWQERVLFRRNESYTQLHLFAFQYYYDVGKKRSLEQFWDHAKMSDEYVTKRDNEGRWEGGLELCKKYGAG